MTARVAIALAILGALAIAGGVALILPAAGLITFGVEALFSSYVVAYIGMRRPR